ncbi:hypothetical protein B0H14DRAFT_2598513 [Mycena olivaceomarginata]|nr:hypothetical protein B0H14DRAFT_2598513 [Mycena olivaceomarginata]
MLVNTNSSTGSTSVTYAYFCRYLLYHQILAAQVRHETSLVDLPAELFISILVLAASSSPATYSVLGIASPWISEIVLRTRISDISTHTKRGSVSFNQLSFNQFVLSSSLASKASIARTLWIATNSGCHPESLLIPDILMASTNFEALACNVGHWKLFAAYRTHFLGHMRIASAHADGVYGHILWIIPSGPVFSKPSMYHYELDFPVAHLPHLAMASGSSRPLPWGAVNPDHPSSYLKQIRVLRSRSIGFCFVWKRQVDHHVLLHSSVSRRIKILGQSPSVNSVEVGEE